MSQDADPTQDGDAADVVEPIVPVGPPVTRHVIMEQDWRDLTFLHWAVPARRLVPFMPPGVRPDTFDGLSYVGLIPFRMVDAGFGRGPAIPWAGTFLETNVRLYSVDSTGRRGIVFLSLDCDRLIVVAGARAALWLPYRWAQMSHRRRQFDATDEHTYTARVRWAGVQARSHVVVRVGDSRASTPLDEFVSARWGLHTRAWGRALYVPNNHETWQLREAEVIALDDGLLRSVGLGDLASRAPDHVAFSDGVHAVFGMPRVMDDPGPPH